MQQQHVTCTWALTCLVAVPICASRVAAASGPLQLAPMDAGARSPSTFSNLRWWRFSFQQLVQTLHVPALALVVFFLVALVHILHAHIATRTVWW